MTTQERAIKMANKRVPNAIKALQLVGELSKQDLSPEHRAKIVEFVSAAYDSVISKFQPSESKQPVFSL
jgi:hypothetical protein